MNQDQHQTEQPKKAEQSSFRLPKLILKVLLWFFLLLVVLFFAAYLLLQTERVQNWAVTKVSTYLSKELNATVKVDYINIEFLDKLVLEGFYVEDQAKDTLIYSKRLVGNLNASWSALFNSQLDIEEIYLDSTRFNLIRRKGEKDHNLQFILDYLSGGNKKDKKAKKPFFLDVDAVYLTDIHFTKEDIPNGQKIDVQLPKGSLKIKDLNLQDLRFEIDQVEILNPIVSIVDSEKFPLPIDTTKLESESVSKLEPIHIDSTKKELLILVNNLTLVDGIFSADNYRKSPIKTSGSNEVDFAHISISDLNLVADSLQFTEGLLDGEVINLSLKESSGFEVEKLYAEQAKISNRTIALNKAAIITPYSQISDTISLKFRGFGDFGNFEDKVYIKAKLKDARVAVKDIMFFAPKMRKNAFFMQNKEEVLVIEGNFSGRVNNLKGKNLYIKLGKSTTFEGNFASHDLTKKNEEILNLNVKQLNTSMQTLKLLIPNFNPPANFDKLGDLKFNGRFDGFFIDFVANGNLTTNLGQANMNMRLDLKPGKTAANYSGEMELIDFDLGKWADNDELGKLNFSSQVKDGKGLTLETVSAKLSSSVEEFKFRGYTYDNVDFEGVLTKNLLDGDLVIKDENIDLTFNGEIELLDSIPFMDFTAKVNKLDLFALNLSKEKFSFSGDVKLDLQDIKLSDMQGKASAYNVSILHNNSNEYQLDSVVIDSKIYPDKTRTLDVQSDIVNGYVNGRYEIQEVSQALIQFFEKNYPEYAKRLNIKGKDKLLSTNQFDFDVQINDSKNFTKLINPNLDTLQDISLIGHFNSITDSIYFEVEVPTLKVKDVNLSDIFLKVDAQGSYGVLDVSVFETTIKDDITLAPITLLSFINRDTVDFGISAINFSEVLDNLNLNGNFFLYGEDNFEVSFSNSNLVLFNDIWDIDASNYIRFGKKYVESKNFEFTNDERSIVIENVNEDGLSLSLENFHLGFIDSLWNYEQLDFSGNFNVSAQIGNLFKLEDISAVLEADSFFVNNDDWGKLRVDADMTDLNNPINAYLSITKGDEQVTLEGFYNLPTAKKNPDYFDFVLDVNKFPLQIADYWIGSGTSNTVGQFDGHARVFGAPKLPNIDGWLRVFNGGITIDYLQTRYYFDDEIAKIDNFLFDATGAIVRDSLGNTATIEGGISHKHLKHLGLNVSGESEQFLFLNTKKEDNPLYYGTGIGSGKVIFTGDFKRPDIQVDATTGEGTKLYIPIAWEQETSEVSFVKFVEKNAQDSTLDATGKIDLRGVNLDMNLNMTDVAEVWMIFDERAGDIIKASGSGNLLFEVTRTGDFNMFGKYFVSSGEYLFTLYNFVNKPFILKDGTLEWSGDPFGAKINLTAEYKGLKPAPYYFIQEYVENLNDANLSNEARQTTEVDLFMALKGDLLQPEIDFDIAFPKLTGELKNFSDSKLRTVRQDQNELNRQVFGLLVIGGFLPSGSFSSDAQYVTGLNTLTELLSNQLSIYLTELLSEAFTDIGFISGVDFDINYNLYQSDQLTGDERVVKRGSEFEVRMKNYLFNDRLSVGFGGNFDVGNGAATSSGSYVAGDFVIEYTLENRNFKIRYYQSTEPSVVEGGRKNKLGLGLSYRKEFDHFIRGMKKAAKKSVEGIEKEIE